MSDTTPSGAGEPSEDANTDGGKQNTDAPSVQETETENGEQEGQEASADDLLSEAQELMKEEPKPDAPPKPVDTKAKDDFQRRDESIRSDALLLRSEGKSNLEIIKELKESGLYPEDQLNRLKKHMASGSLEESKPQEEPENKEQEFEKWYQQKEAGKEKEASLKWFTESHAKELGINAKTNAVAIESRKKLLTKANELYSQTLPEHRNFKNSLTQAAAILGFNDKTKLQEAVKKATKLAHQKVGDDGKPQKTEKTSYKYTEFSEIRKKNKDEAKRIMRLVKEGKVKLVNDTV